MIKGEYAKTIQEHDQVNNVKQKNKTKHTFIKERKKERKKEKKKEHVDEKKTRTR